MDTPEHPNLESDTDLEQLLRASYDVPPVPEKLRQRVEAAVEQEWGLSPRVARAPSPWWTKAGVPALRSWPVVAGLVLVVILGVVFQGNSRAYGWAAMVEALAKQGIVQVGRAAVGSSSVRRWLSVSNGILSCNDSGDAQCVDLRRGVVLQKQRGGQQVELRRLERRAPTGESEQLLLAFLCEQPAVSPDSDLVSRLSVVDERWKPVGEDVELRVKVAATEPQGVQFDLTIVLDPVTHLPRTCQIEDGVSARELVFSYPDVSAGDLLAEDFPPELPIVDVAAHDALAVAAAEEPKPSEPALSEAEDHP